MILLLRSYNNIFSKFWWQVDKLILFPICLLLCISIILVITASPFVAMRIGVESLYFIKHHLLYSLFFILIIFIVALLNERQLSQLAKIGFIISILLMALVIITGTDIKGAKRWFHLFGLSIQPSEFAKIFFIGFMVYLWDYFSQLKKNLLFKYMVWLGVYIGFILLLLLQPDVGMTILVTIILGTLLFVTGISYLWVVLSMFASFAIFVAAYFAFSHVAYRVNTFLFAQKSYQISKAIDAISSGKIWGKGAGQGSVKTTLPDAYTDFIFAVGLEEFGLMFSIGLIYIYIYIMFRIVKHIKHTNSLKNILALSGYLSLLATQTLIHIASNINLIPTKGVTLPIVSYGGSSLIATAFLIGFILNLTKKDINNIVVKN